MSRKVPDCPPAPAVTEHHPGRITSEYDISVITPIVGGGVEPHHNDPFWLVRPTAVRGHLRFWWRATRGADCATVAELFEREGRIWGTTKDKNKRAIPSPVEVEATITAEGDRKRWPEFPGAAYVLFALRELGDQTVQQNVRFTLTVCYPSALRDDVEGALWAWTNFGGIGARTRRGCGALFCSEFAPPTAALHDWFVQSRNKRHLPSTPAEVTASWPMLVQPPVAHPTVSDPIAAWSRAVSLLRDFRQGYGIGRNPGPGRSRWPEADSIRAVTGGGSAAHSHSVTLDNPGAHPGFPRAELGLPIVFHFIRESLEATLEPSNAARMSSPIILRPLAFGRGTQSVAIALWLYAAATPGVKLKWAGAGARPPTFGRDSVIDPAFARYSGSPMNGRTKTGWAREALYSFAYERGFR